MSEGLPQASLEHASSSQDARPARRWAVSYDGGYGFCLRLDLNPSRASWEHFRFPEKKEYHDDALDWLLAVRREVEGVLRLS